MPTANITNPTNLSPNITNDSSYTVTWTVSGAIGFGATWKLQIQPPGSVSFQDISTSLPGPTTSFVWTKQASASIIVAKGLDELATGTYNLRLLYIYRGRNFILDTQSFNMFRRFTATVTDEIEVDDSPGFNRGYEISWSVILGGILDVNDNIAYRKGVQRSRLDALDINEIFNIQKGKQKTRIDLLDINEVISVNKGTQKTRLDLIDVNDFVAFGTTAGVAQVYEKIKVIDNLLEINRGRNLECFEEILIDYTMGKKAHRTFVTKNINREYILTKDEMRYKHVVNSHSSQNNPVLSSMSERIATFDYLIYQTASNTKQRIQSKLNVYDNLKMVKIEKEQSLVYHLDYDSFTKYSGLDAKEFSAMIKGSEKDNINLIISNSNKIFKFPGKNITDKDGFIETKTLYLERGVAQKIMLEHEGEVDFIETNTLPVEGQGEEKSHTIDKFENEKYVMLPQNIGRIRSIAFKFFNIDKIKKFIFNYKQRINE